eukprot:TRINITY_DN1150_c0_g5_i2.p1 TRINITY_DN1150_c0_g5~~TRINITY_DN1150_c0_g5_i2.p1  ORF type:complete len:753 (+),score=92.79 TRINITY_DN1150_c0_g5_i2:50-2308(+)
MGLGTRESNPLRRIYYGVLFATDMFVTLFVYICFHATATNGFQQSWEDDVAAYSLSDSSFDLMVSSILRSVVLLYTYSYLGIDRSIVVAVCAFSSTVVLCSVKAAVADEITAFTGTMLVLSLLYSLLETVVIVQRVKGKRGRSKNPFFKGSEDNFFVISNMDPNVTTGTGSKMSLVHPSLQRYMADSRFIPTSAAKKIEWAQSIQEQLLSSILAESRDNNSWRILIDNSDVLVFTKEVSRKSVLCFKSVTLVETDPSTLRSFLLRDNPRKSWNPMFRSVSRVEEIRYDQEVVNVTMPMLGPVKPRDMCCLKVTRDTIEGGFIMGMKSVFHPDNPEVQKYVRAEMILQGYTVRPHKSRPGTSLFYSVLIIDLKGWIPERIVDLVAETQTKTLVSLRNLILSYERKSLTVDRDLESVTSLSPTSGSYSAPSRTSISQQYRADSRRVTKGERDFDVESELDRGGRSPKFGAGRVIYGDESIAMGHNLLGRLKIQGLPTGTTINDHVEFVSSWKNLLVLAVDLHQEDRIADAYGVLQVILRSLELHRAFTQDHLEEDCFLEKDSELAKILQHLEKNSFVQLIQRDSFEGESWVRELQSRAEWSPLSLSEDIQIWARSDRGELLPTFLCEGGVDSPLVDCFAILNEIEQMQHWIPNAGSHVTFEIKVVEHLTRMSKIIQIIFHLPFPFQDKEVIGHIKGMDLLDRGHVLLVMQPISQFEGVELPPIEPSRQRIEISAAYVDFGVHLYISHQKLATTD